MHEVFAKVREGIHQGEVTVPGLGRFSIYERGGQRMVRLRYAVRADRMLDGSVTLEGVAVELVAAARQGPVEIDGLGTFAIAWSEGEPGVTPPPPGRWMLRFHGARL